ncbi:hypothetical protein C0991_011112 [Blastosporella zonata]|nr:hypothetical protein C0991_011112 [Blastosporella zonata]
MHRRAALACTPPHDTQAFLHSAYRRVSNGARPRHQPASTFTKKEPMRLPKDDYDRAKRTTLKVIERAAHQPPNWKDTPTLRGKENRLSILVKTAQERKSVEQEAFDESNEVDDYTSGVEANDHEGISSTLPAGTFIECRRSLILTYGVVIGEVLINQRRRMMTIMSNGEIWCPALQDVVYSLPNFIAPDLLQRCGNESLPRDDVQKNARIQLLRRVSEIMRSSEVMYNIVAQRSGLIYDQVKSPDPAAWATTTVSHIARLIATKKPDEMFLFGLHKYVLADSLHFIAHQGYQTTKMLIVRPQSHVDDIKTVLSWTRRRDSPIHSFVAKARKLMPSLAAIQESSRSEPPSYGPAAHTWTDTDRTIIRFLQRSLRQIRTNQSDPYTLAVSHIMKDLYPGETVDQSAVYTTVVNLGALAPWQDLTALDPALQGDIEPEPTSSVIKQQEAIAARSFASMASSGTDTPLGPEDFYRTDPLESVRHDFGDLPVYVIDDASAHELDDGVSIERIPSEPDSVWVHTHVADPAALIPPTHVLAKEAYRRGSSIYLTHRAWSLLPNTLMTHPTHGLSLAMGRHLNGSPLKVLSFSSKIDSQGNVTDYKVRGGLIRNVNVITYDEADAALGRYENLAWYPFGRQSQPTPKRHALPEDSVKDIQDLDKAANILKAARSRAGVISPTWNVAEVFPITYPPREVFGLITEPTIFRGFPTSEYRVSSAADLDTGARSIVAEAMKLASRIASRFCTEHNTPIMRRVSDPRSVSFSGDIQELWDQRLHNSSIPRRLLAQRMESNATSGYSMEPKAHYHLGIPDGEGYTRVTSPLRRYMDLVAHWQIHHTLLGSTARRPFSAEEIWDISKVSGAVENQYNIVERTHRRFWQVMFIKRWVDENKEEARHLLSNIDAYTLSKVTTNARKGNLQVSVDCPYLGFEAALEGLPNIEAFPPGTSVNVKVEDLILGTRPQVIASLNDSKKYIC